MLSARVGPHRKNPCFTLARVSDPFVNDGGLTGRLQFSYRDTDDECSDAIYSV